MIKQYKKRPVVVKAIQWLGDNFISIDEFITCKHSTFPQDGKVEIETLEGTMVANIGDYIIKGVKGEFYPCRQDIFEQTYDEVLSRQT